ncbi:TonB-dependent siderophore receptor [Methylocella sp.]|uniref:TonB-dependent siderophore receptor n=1 Tax=Methylocella sp. TaxID=1978226 RepID=UPI0037838C4D
MDRSWSAAVSPLALAAAACSLVVGALAPAQGARSEPAAGAVELEAVDVQGPAGGGQDQAGGQSGAFVQTETSAATKTDTPLIETPQAVTVITQKQLEERNVQTLSQALDYTAGVQNNFGYDPRFDSFSIRGVDVTTTGLFRDGLRLAGSSFSLFKTEPYALQNVTVLKGPASVLYGATPLGGLVDMTSKRPTLTPFREVEFNLGSYQRYQGNFDLGGPIDPAGVFSYRLTGVFRDAGSQFVGLPDDRQIIAPAITYKPDEATTFTFLSEYGNILTTANTSYWQTAPGQLTKLYSGDPNFGTLAQTQFRIGYEFEHKFDETFTFRQNVAYYHVVTDGKYVDIADVDPATQIASRVTGRVVDHLGTLSADNQLHVKFATGPVSHQVLLGFDYSNTLLNEKVGYGDAPDLFIGSIPPAYGGQFIPSPVYSSYTEQFQQDIGVYAQDQARFGPFVLTLSGRNDWVLTKSQDFVGQTDQTQKDQAATGRVGLTYVSPIGLAPYVSYSTAFTPTAGFTAEGEAFKPIHGDQKEVGVKYQPDAFKGIITASLFDIHEYNVLSTDPNNDLFQIQTGEIGSRGFELEAVMNPLPGLDVTLAYTLLHLRIIDGDAGTVGNVPSGIPSQTFSTYGDYTLQPGSFAPGLGAGFGMRYLGKSYGDDQNSFVNQPVTLFDAAVHYDFGQLDRRLEGLRFQVNATNLFNTRYSISQSGFGYWGQSRMVIGSLRYRW